MATLPKSLPSPQKSKSSSVTRRKTAASKPRHAQSMAASLAKAHLLSLIDQVHLERTPVTITKRGRPLVKLVPIEETPLPDIFGCMKGTFRITGDIVGPEPDSWEAMS